MKFVSLIFLIAITFCNYTHAQPGPQPDKIKSIRSQKQKKAEQKKQMAPPEASEIQTTFDYTAVAVGGVIGFGLGHTLQLRYWDAGWKFTLIDLGSFMLIGAGFRSYEGGAIIAGFATLLASHIWQAVDLWQAAGTVRASLQPEPKFRYALLPNSGDGANIVTSFRF